MASSSLNLSSSTLNTLSTIFGLIAGASTLLGSTGVVNQATAGAISGIATAILGYLVQKPASVPTIPNATVPGQTTAS